MELASEPHLSAGAAALPPCSLSQLLDQEHNSEHLGCGRGLNRALSSREATRLRTVIEAAIAEIFGVPTAELSRPSRGKAPIALARQAAMYLAHVACGLTLTEVGQIFARDRTTVAHACGVIEDRRDDPVFDHALALMEWIVPTLIGPRPVTGDPQSSHTA